MTSPPGKINPDDASRMLPSSMFASQAARTSEVSEVSRLVGSLVAAWNRGEQPRAEAFLQANPHLDDESAIRLIFEEFCLREDTGFPVLTYEIARRFPQWKADLELLLDCRRMMTPSPTGCDMATVGEEIAGFRLLAELGRGMTGRVFLASQIALGDRSMVIKVTPRGRQEHLSLAQLQHMNIVPLYSAEVIADRGLQTICMPFLGNATLAHVLDRLRDCNPLRRTGKDLVRVIEKAQSGLPVPVSSGGPFLRYLAGASYEDAICWMGACLADGLQYAHDRNLIHMDVKPSNILIGFDGQPMLLDFHLARRPIQPDDPGLEWLGGTPHYMAPEQRSAVDDLSRGLPPSTSVDGRADLYALGKILDEALAGVTTQGVRDRPLHRINPRVSVGLSDILARCQARDPRDRYACAADMAADLRCHLNAQPLRGVPNRSLRERWRKLRRRSPHAISRMLILGVLAVVVVAAASAWGLAARARLDQVQTSLAEGRKELDRHDYARAADLLERGLSLSAGDPLHSSHRGALADDLAFARKALMAQNLHALANLVRFRHGLAPPGEAEARRLVRKGRDVWASRQIMLANTPLPRDDAEMDRSLRADLMDFALFWADLRVRSASDDERQEAAREALAMLDQTAEDLGMGPALARDRATYARMIGRLDADSGPLVARSAGDHYDLGRSYLRSGDLAAAESEFRRGVALRPQDFWLNFYQGLCAYRRARFNEAASAFRVCVSLAPDTAECYYNRALALAANGLIEAAIDDNTRALELAPSLGEAALNRGILHFRQGRLDKAQNDLQRALRLASDPVSRGTIHYNLALVDLARKDDTAARNNLTQAAKLNHKEAIQLLNRLR